MDAVWTLYSSSGGYGKPLYGWLFSRQAIDVLAL